MCHLDSRNMIICCKCKLWLYQCNCQKCFNWKWKLKVVFIKSKQQKVQIKFLTQMITILYDIQNGDGARYLKLWWSMHNRTINICRYSFVSLFIYQRSIWHGFVSNCSQQGRSTVCWIRCKSDLTLLYSCLSLDFSLTVSQWKQHSTPGPRLFI